MKLNPSDLKKCNPKLEINEKAINTLLRITNSPGLLGLDTNGVYEFIKNAQKISMYMYSLSDFNEIILNKGNYAILIEAGNNITLDETNIFQEKHFSGSKCITQLIINQKYNDNWKITILHFK